jgi:transcriptional regulator with XRE-family HTH domain
MSQTALGRAAGITFQQVQKYESGFNRMACSRLYEFSRILHVPVSYFFEEIGAPAAPRGRSPNGPQATSVDSGVDLKGEILRLVRAYYKIGDARVRQHIRSMVKVLAESQS